MKDVAGQLAHPGSVGIVPTDTVYGIVARAEDKAAVERLYELKHRVNKPGTLIAANLKQLEELGLKHRYLKAVEQFWPGAISVVIPVGDPKLAYLHRGKQSLAVRIPRQGQLKKVLLKTGPLLTSSANPPEAPPAVNLMQAKAYFHNEVDFYEDGGDLSDRKPSTIIRVVDDAIEVLRQGDEKV
jgi:L-threonylcarbamoyladenylate synthase